MQALGSVCVLLFCFIDVQQADLCILKHMAPDDQGVNMFITSRGLGSPSCHTSIAAVHFEWEEFCCVSHKLGSVSYVEVGGANDSSARALSLDNVNKLTAMQLIK